MKALIIRYSNLFNPPLEQFEAEVGSPFDAFDLACDKWAPFKAPSQRNIRPMPPKIRNQALNLQEDQHAWLGFLTRTDVAVILFNEVPKNV